MERRCEGMPASSVRMFPIDGSAATCGRSMGTTAMKPATLRTDTRDFQLPEVGLLIRAPYVDWILDGLKVWEMRSKRTARRGRIGLIRSTSGLVVGEANLVAVEGPLTHRELLRNAEKNERRARGHHRSR